MRHFVIGSPDGLTGTAVTGEELHGQDGVRASDKNRLHLGSRHREPGGDSGADPGGHGRGSPELLPRDSRATCSHGELGTAGRQGGGTPRRHSARPFRTEDPHGAAARTTSGSPEGGATAPADSRGDPGI